MFKINKKTEYALIILKCMSEQQKTKKLLSAREICENFGIPFDTTSKVMQYLNNEGILKSVKGIHGGYFLDFNLASISLKDLILLVEGKNECEFSSCHHPQKGPCDFIEKCNITRPMQNLQNRMSKFLEQISLQELLLEDTEASKI